MAKLTAFLFVALLLMGAFLPGCSKDTVMDVYGDLVAAAGNVGLTASFRLQGERTFGADKYTGTYKADYEDFTGQECPFGGTMLEHRAQEHVEVTVSIEGEGDAKLVWMCGADGPVTVADGPGAYTETAYLAPGSNYFNLEFDHFTGTVELEIK